MTSQKHYASALGRTGRRTAGTLAVFAASMLVTTAALSQDLSSFAILAADTITNTGTTTINGNIGLWPGTSFTGQASVVLDPDSTGDSTVYIAPDAVALRAQNDLTIAYNFLRGRSPTTELTGDLGGKTLTRGIYSYASDATMTGTLTLDAGLDPDAIFIIKIERDFTTASGPGASAVLLTNGAQAKNVFFVIGRDVTLGTYTDFAGQIYALNDIVLQTYATIDCGAALTQTGAVTLDTNTIDVCNFTTSAEQLEDILGDDITGNGGSITDAIADYVDGGGELPAGFILLGLLSPTELADAMEQLSGELGTEVAPAGTQGMDAFLDLLGGSHDSRALLHGYGDAETGATVSVMGYMPASPESGDDAFAEFDASASRPQDGEWTAWMSGYGSRSEVDGDGDTGSHATTSSAYGLAFGFERDLGPDAMFGLAVSGGGTNFDLENSLGSGKSAMLQAALYARGNFDDAYVAGAVAVGYHRVSLDRTLTIAGADHYTADFDATNVAGEIEAGYHFGWFTPYVALRGQAFSTPAYSEVTDSGASTFALDYDANVATSLRTEIGARGDWSTDLDEGGKVNLYASAAWAHDMRAGYDMTATFQLMPGSPFVVAGASPATDSLLATAGAEFTTAEGVALGTSVQGEVSGNALTYGATASLSYRW